AQIRRTIYLSHDDVTRTDVDYFDPGARVDQRAVAQDVDAAAVEIRDPRRPQRRQRLSVPATQLLQLQVHRHLSDGGVVFRSAEQEVLANRRARPIMKEHGSEYGDQDN